MTARRAGDVRDVPCAMSSRCPWPPRAVVAASAARAGRRGASQQQRLGQAHAWRAARSGGPPSVAGAGGRVPKPPDGLCCPKALWLGSSPRGASERGHQKMQGTPTGGGATPRLSPSRTAGPRGRGGVPSGPRERAAWAWPVPSSAMAALPDLEHLPVCRSTCCSSNTPPPPSPSPRGWPPLRAPPPRRRRHSWPPEFPASHSGSSEQRRSLRCPVTQLGRGRKGTFGLHMV